MSNNQPKPVDTKFKDNGFTYTQMKREGFITLYAVIHKTGKILGYEVAILTVEPAEKIRGVTYPKRERYPSNEDFGTNGWYYQHLERAESCFDSLVKSLRDTGGCSDSSPSAA